MDKCPYCDTELLQVDEKHVWCEGCGHTFRPIKDDVYCSSKGEYV